MSLMHARETAWDSTYTHTHTLHSLKHLAINHTANDTRRLEQGWTQCLSGQVLSLTHALGGRGKRLFIVMYSRQAKHI